ncbi:MAG: methyltransferase domain-containing protein, partial [Bdellovibrionales bacterium]|nr:methyltransferase domain-containing protein [Bdellovibrionales bacterium]
MKIHRPICQAIVEIVSQIFFESRYADKAIEYAFKNNRKWGSKDRKFIAEAVYDIVRYWRTYEHFVEGIFPDQPNTIWAALGLHLKRNGNPIPDWTEFDLVRSKKYDDRSLDDLALRESFPDWMVAEIRESWGDQTPQILSSLNDMPPVFLRVNTLKISRDELIRELVEEEIPAEKVFEQDCAIVLSERKNTFQTKSFLKGHFEVQDLSSQKVAAFCQVKPKDKVIDACAGAGGKSLHLAVQMNNKGKIIALDPVERKLKELRKRASRNGIDIIEVRVIEGTKTTKRLEKSADVVLLDVPCSGTGVIRRNPDTKWKLQPEDLVELKKTQNEILGSYSRMVKPGGALVYSTCSLLKSE